MSGRFRDVEHVLRVVGIFIVGLLTFLVVRWWLVPPDFGVYGHYRAGAIAENQARPLVHAGQAACLDCHADIVEIRQAGRHAIVHCEACHGPLARHAAAEDDAKPVLPDPRTTCIRCHDARAGKPAAFPQVVVSEHADEGPCTACHQPHNPGVS